MHSSQQTEQPVNGAVNQPLTCLWLMLSNVMCLCRLTWLGRQRLKQGTSAAIWTWQHD